MTGQSTKLVPSWLWTKTTLISVVKRCKSRTDNERRQGTQSGIATSLSRQGLKVSIFRHIQGCQTPEKWIGGRGAVDSQNEQLAKLFGRDPGTILTFRLNGGLLGPSNMKRGGEEANRATPAMSENAIWTHGWCVMLCLEHGWTKRSVPVGQSAHRF